ncbi:efflux RND transporter periplasmic adaptor subunit [Thiomicrospira sp. R3]|uniref:efflux RND transporter periplasmic adaptor subunit n=1 Tax=Thiomicrospira sp. R3 TaxID=3035472 RepID=UPI00259B0481|nr:efflux RND transporter periplasmic adaptor subunit [Thiomicrospira sp. R3]WFE69095.1 efflux RND transporter periplasmic adaptor subunit [Thiomicrospira sp. R3]
MFKHLLRVWLLASLSFFAYANSNVPQVIVGTVSGETIVETINALGTLSARESVALSVSVTERVESIHFQDGQQVNKGQVLVRLVSQEERASLDELNIVTQDAKRQYERFVPLFQRGDISQSILDERKRDWDLARAREAVLQARLEKLTLVAPFSGQVGLRQVSEGSLLTPGTVVAELKDLSQMKLDFTVPSRFLTELAPGLTLSTETDAYSNQRFSGQIETILPQVDPVTRSVQVRANIDNTEGLLMPGMLMKVTLQQQPRSVLFIPETAIVPIADKQFVYVLNPDEDGLFKLQRKQVQLGMRQPGLVEVVSGLKLGDKVVSEGALRVRPAQLVRALDKLERKSDMADQEDKL